MSHINSGIPARSRLGHRDLDDVRVPPHNLPSRLPGRRGRPPSALVGGLLGRPPGRTAPPGRRSTHRPSQSAVAIKLPGRRLQPPIDPPCVLCVRGNLARHTFPDKGSDAAEALAVVHIDLSGPFQVAAKDGSLYFLLLKDRHSWFVWAMPVAKKSDVLWEFQKWLVLVERQAKQSVLMLYSDRGGEFLGKDFTDFVDGKGIIHDLTCPYTLQQNGMAEQEMRMVINSLSPEQQRGGKLAPKTRWGLHLGVSLESKGWEVLDLTDNKVVLTVEVVFYETLSLEVWKAKYGPASGRTQAHPPTDTSMATVSLLTEVDEPADEDVMEVPPPSLVLAPPSPIADRPSSTPVSATGDEGILEASPVAPASGIAGGRQGAKLIDQDGKASSIGEQQTGEPVEEEGAVGVQSTGEWQPGRSTGELSKSPGGEQPVKGSKQLVDDVDVDEEGELSAGEESTDSDVVEVPLDPDVHADPEHRWDIATMTVKDALRSWKGEVVKAAMDEEIRSLIGMGTWELVECPRGLNVMKNRWVLTTKSHIDYTVEREKARLVVKGFTQMYDADYEKTYSPVSSYVTLRIFLSIVTVLDLNLMQLDMKNAFL
ncbi:unnamed protein product [Closterium sp. NIES-53]